MNDQDPRNASRRMFEQAVADLDAGTANRLRLMRREAIAATGAARPRRLLPAFALTAAVLVIGLAWRFATLPPSGGTTAAQATPAIDLASDEDAALYAWLGDAPVAADGEAL